MHYEAGVSNYVSNSRTVSMGARFVPTSEYTVRKSKIVLLQCDLDSSRKHILQIRWMEKVHHRTVYSL